MQETFADELRAQRRRKGWTQQELSDKSGVSRLLINKIENGKALNVRESTIKDVAKALGIMDTPKMTAAPAATVAAAEPETPGLRERVEQLERELARERAWTEKLWQENQQLKAGQLGKTLASSDAADTKVIPMFPHREEAA